MTPFRNIYNGKSRNVHSAGGVRRLQLRGRRVGGWRAPRSWRLVESGIGAFHLVTALMTVASADHRSRLRHQRLFDQVRPALFGRGAAAVLQADVVLGRARRLDHVLGDAARHVRQRRRLRQPRSPPRADPVRRRHDRRRADVLPLPDGDPQQPVRDVPDAGAGRRARAEPAAAELLHGDPSAVAVPRASSG